MAAKCHILNKCTSKKVAGHQNPRPNPKRLYPPVRAHTWPTPPGAF